MSDASNGNGGTAGGTGRTAFEAVPWAASGMTTRRRGSLRAS